MNKLTSYFSRNSGSSSNNSSSNSSSTSADPFHSANDRGYGNTTTCNSLQQAWQTSHPHFCAVRKDNPPRRSPNDHHWLQPNPTVCLPPPIDLLGHLHNLTGPDKPDLIDYVQLPLHLWVPDYFYPSLVPFTPCPQQECKLPTRRIKWRSGGPRVIHGLDSAIYLHCWEYQCTTHGFFKGWDSRCLGKLPLAVQQSFRYRLTLKEGVTDEVMREIVSARMSGSSLQALSENMNQARHDRLYHWMIAYHQNCNQHRMQAMLTGNGKGENLVYQSFPPTLHCPAAYYDHPAPSCDYLRELYDSYCLECRPLWEQHTQQHVADRVAIDATFKIAKKIANSPYRMMWTMIDVDTGIICAQQMLTHERRADVLPMLQEYGTRCVKMNKELPTRVSTDRGVKDMALIKDPTAFPCAHVSLDNWHFQQLFLKTLNKQSPVYRQCHQAFTKALYKEIVLPSGKTAHTHAEPDDIVRDVNALVSTYSAGLDQGPAVTKATKLWWQAQIPDITQHRILSNPAGSMRAAKVSSSRLEGYHKELNRLTRLVQTSAGHMDSHLMHLMFTWNTDRRVQSELDHDWGTYDLPLVISAFQSMSRLLGEVEAKQIFLRSPVPPLLDHQEHFALVHSNETMTRQIAAADQPLPYTEELLQQIAEGWNAEMDLLGKAVTKAVIEQATVQDTSSSSTDQMQMIQTAATAAVIHAARMTSSQWLAQHSNNTPMQLSATARHLLKVVLKVDKEMIRLVALKQWELVAARWNTLVSSVPVSTHFTVSSSAQQLLTVTEDVIRRETERAIRRSVTEMEQHYIHLATSKSPYPYKAVGARKHKFSVHEDNVLGELVDKYRTQGKHRKNGKSIEINWLKLYGAWIARWINDQTNKATPALLARSSTQLKSRWRSIGDQTPQSTATTAPPDTVTPVQDNITISVVEEQLIHPLIHSSIPFVPPAPIIEMLADSQLVTITIDASSTAVSNKNIWTKQQRTHFKTLYTLHGPDWTYKEFEELWDSAAYGQVDADRWRTRNQTEKRVLKNAEKQRAKRQRTE